MLTELSLGLSWIKSSRDVTELNVCKSRRCRIFGTRIGRIVKTYDYINRVVITLPLTVYEGTWTDTLPSRCYAITMILNVRRNFFEITTFPNSGIRA